MRRDLHSAMEGLDDLHLARQKLSEHFAAEDARRVQNVLTQCWTQIAEQEVNSVQVAGLLKAMEVDADGIIAALLCETPNAQAPPDLSTSAQAILRSVEALTSLSSRRADLPQPQQTERLRRLLLASVDDVRAVLIVLARETRRLNVLIATDPQMPDSVRLAREVMDIYAPLANRLGVGQLKWELEDLAFRVLEPDNYRRVARTLEERREQREQYIDEFVITLAQHLHTAGLVNAKVFGRPKHIYSIFKKMRNKRLRFEDLYDVRAVRVLVDNLTECYTGLGVVHSAWAPITKEFDDYIANPKENGYQSLHTAVIGPQGKPLEVQIRTHKMNDDAELGVAAHWQYKEGGGQQDDKLQRSINALRGVLEGSEDGLDDVSQDIFADRVFAFTPRGDVIDLSRNSTPLDFAYNVHTNIGHRCRGAKVNGEIVPLTRALKNGDKVEILTGKEPRPSRDWLHQELGFLHSARARGKVRQWFNQQDLSLHLNDGKELLERELKRHNARTLTHEQLASRLRCGRPQALYVALARNEISAAQLTRAIEALMAPAPADEARVLKPRKRKNRSGDICVLGVGNLMTTMANCCQPVPYDAIIGFITRGRGVSVHRADCINMLNLPEQERARLIQVDWGEEQERCYSAKIQLSAFDRPGLLRDIDHIVSSGRAHLVDLNTRFDRSEQIMHMTLGLEVEGVAELGYIMKRLQRLANIFEVERAR